MSKLIITRHGQSIWNAENRFTGWVDVDLSEKGIKEAEKSGELRKKEEEKNKLEGDKKKIEWGSQIRNYVLHPYKLVKDLRTNYETSNTDAVLNGEINDFIKTYLIEFSK